MITRPLLLLVATTAALAASPALAETAPRERVSYADLNIATLEGQAELQKRLDSASRRVCRFDADGQLRTADQENACYRVSRRTAAAHMAQVVSVENRGG